MNLSLLFISHDIGVVRYISSRIGVMYLGTLVEEAGTDELFSHPLHPYTQALFAPFRTLTRRRERSILRANYRCTPMNLRDVCSIPAALTPVTNAAGQLLSWKKFVRDTGIGPATGWLELQ